MTETRKAITEYELLDHGIDNCQYFPGCGVSLTEFEDVATGCGDTPAEAINDALEQLAMSDWDADSMEARILADEKWAALPELPSVYAEYGDDGEDCYYYVSIRVR